MIATEVRVTVDRLTADYPNDNEQRCLDEAIDHLFTAIDYQRIDWALPGEEPEPDELGSHVWCGLDLVQEGALTVLVAAAKRRAYRAAREAIVAEVIAAAESFARQYPDAPRAPREAVPA